MHESVGEALNTYPDRPCSLRGEGAGLGEVTRDVDNKIGVVRGELGHSEEFSKVERAVRLDEARKGNGGEYADRGLGWGGELDDLGAEI